MEWNYLQAVKEYQLTYNNTILARIQTVPGKNKGFKVKTLISGIYFGERVQKCLERRKKEWVAYKKKFSDQESAQSYIKRKMDVVTKFILAREKEV